MGLTFKRPKGCETGPFEVVNVVPAGAASFSGIKVGTFFDAVDGVNVSALTNQEVSVLVKGKPSTPLELRFCHPPTLVRKGGGGGCEWYTNNSEGHSEVGESKIRRSTRQKQNA